MPKIVIKRTQEEIDQAKAMLAEIQDGFVRAYSRALNKSVDGTQTDMVKIAREDYTFKVDAVQKRMWTNKSTWTNLRASVHSKGGPVHLTDFLGTKQISTGLSVNVKRATGIQHILHGFIQKGRSSGKLIAFRRGKVGEVYPPGSAYAVQMSQSIQAGHITPEGRVYRKPMVALYGPHPEVTWNTDDNWDRLSRWADERMTAAFEHEVDYVLQQYG